METVVSDMKVEDLLMFVSEMDLYGELIPGIKESKEVAYLTRNRRLGYSLFDFPVINYREAFFLGSGYDRLNHNDSILMFNQSIHNRPDLCQKLNYQPKLNK